MATPTAGPTMASPILNMLDTNLEVASLASTPAQSNNSIEHLQVKRSSDVKEVEVYIPTNITRRVKINDDDLGPEIIESGEVTRPEGPQQKVKQPIKQEKSKQQKIEQPTIPEPQQKEPVTAEQTTTEKLVPLQENLAGYNLEEAMRIFKAEHEQYVQSLISDQESTLAQEIREIYCSTATDHKLNLVAMAQTNGLLAASVLFPTKTCAKLTGMGQVILLQQCRQETVTLTHKETRCGIEPIIENENGPPLTLARDGMSTYPFAECYWPNGIINVNGKPHEFKKGIWIQREPTVHFKHLKLIEHFPKLQDNSIDYLLNPRQVHENRGIEQANVLAELVARIQQTNANSLDPLVLSETSSSNFWDISGWMSKLKIILFSVIGIIGTAIIIAVTIKILPITKIRALINQRKEVAVNMVENVELIPKHHNAPQQNEEPKHEHEQTVYVKGIGLLWTKCHCMAVPIAPEHLNNEQNV